MQERIKISLEVLAGCIVLCLILYFGLNFYVTRPSCHLEFPLGCHDPQLGPDGFMLNLDNLDTETIYIQDITISKKDGERCYYRKKEIINPDTDFYSILAPQRSTFFFTDAEHIDGACLMEDMKVGNNYEYVLEIVFFHNDEKKTIIGGGYLKYSKEDVNPFE